jgi:amino acid adenylation domain-containing protein/non-ribosomal peptide synthase protein (TIGR01720 family)
MKKNIEEFLSDLCSLDVKLWIEGDRLRCNAPKDSLTPVIKAELAERKQEILAFIRDNNVAIATDERSIRPVKRQENLPLSFAQQRLWFVERLTNVSQLYDVPTCLHLKGSLNFSALKSSLNELVRRHEILRTTFTLVEGNPVQKIHSTFNLSLPIVNIQELSQAERETEVKRLIKRETSRCFDLEEGPLLRCILLQLDPKEHILLFTIHHIITDGWSTGVIIRELAPLYQAFTKNRPSPLPELPIQYVDFAVWQRQYLQGEVMENLLTYWKQKLNGNLPVLQLPMDYPRPAIQTFSGQRKSFFLSKELTRELKVLSRNQDATLFMTLLAGFKVLLHRYSGQEDILIGSPIANRNQEHIDQLIGFFVNTLVLRTDLSGNPSFYELLKRIRGTTLGAYAHQDMPFELLVQELQPERNLSYTPLFSVVFVLHNAPIPALEMSGLALTPLETVDHRNLMFDLIIHITETEEGLLGSLDYNTDLFKEDTICRMADHLQTLFAGIVANPQQRLSELPLLTESEQHQLLREWNNTEVADPQLQCIHQLFEMQVQKTPNSVAVVFEDQQLTYRELNTKANQLAHYLRNLGVKPEVKVGICVERSLEMVIGLLAILKADGAYVPLDPAYPPERLTFAFQDTQLQVLLTQQNLIKSLPEHQTKVVCLDTDWVSIAEQSSQNPIIECTVDNLAYIIYTSGSTGQPKGVLVNHSNVVRLFTATKSWFNFNQNDIFTLFHSIAFDFSVWEIWGALLHGGQLIVVPYWLSRSPEDFYKLLLKQQVTILNQTPSAFRQLIQVDKSLSNSHNLSLRKVIFGGEALQLESLRPWFERHDDQSPQLINMYGITETTVHVTYCPLTKANLEVASESLIGRPIPDLQVYLLDSYGQPVPIGVPGEIYIGGSGVVRGYLNRPELTSERFIPDSFSEQPNTRLYKSGDLARYLNNGDLEYLGRIDHQVKVRGFRIELGEIEAVISQYPAVRETVVITHKVTVDSQQIVAYVVPQEEQTLTISELRSFLESKMPSYMVPATFILLEALPLTANGKVDRRALPTPDKTRPQLEEVFVAPRTKEEAILADIWTKVLDLRQVGIHDNFFSLGGDSIRSIQVQSQAQEQGLNFSIQQLFQFQTIDELAKISLTAKQSNAKANLVKPFELLSAVDRQKLSNDLEDAYPLSQLQAGMFFHSIYSPDTAITYHNVTSFHLKVPFDLEKLQIAIHELTTYHPLLRTSFDLVNYSEPIQFVHQTVSIPLEVQDLRHLSPTEQDNFLAEWFEAEKNQEFDWTCPPLLRFQIHRRSKDTFQFSFAEHHAILDGWSLASMLTELFGRYLSLLDNKISLPDPSLTTAYKDFIALEREALVSEECVRYWNQKLHNNTVTTVPRWSNSERVSDLSNGQHSVEISVEVSRGLKKLAKVAGIPLKSILLAAHLRVLSLLSNQTDVVTGLVSNGRLESADGDKTLGLFLNTLPFRLQLSGGTWLDLVQTTFDVERELLPYRRYPLAEIQKILGQQLLFETAFNFTNFHVYQGIAGFDNTQLLSSKSFAITNFALCADFGLDEFSSEIHLDLEYDSKEFSLKQIEVIGDYYARTLDAIVSEPNKRYEFTSLLSPIEEHQLLVEWNDTEVDYPQDKCIHQLFEAQVEKTPDAVAVVFENQQLTYRELNAKANQLAHYLRKKVEFVEPNGSSPLQKPERLVGICVERSFEMLIGILGILKAGFAYIPIDPHYASGRINYILSDAEISLLITQAKLSQPTPSVKTILLDTDWQIISTESKSNLACHVNFSNLAYSIYTSGSTGTPKGVLIQHDSLVNFVYGAIDRYKISKSDRVLQFASISFDVAVEEIYPSLISSGTVILADSNMLNPATAFISKCQELEITVLDLPTVYWQQLVAEIVTNHLAVPECIRLVIIGGEQVNYKYVRQWQNYIGETTQLINAYGPTEATVETTTCLLSNKSLGRLPIGKPLPNAQVYVLNSNLQPVPIGVVGELYIGGIGIARGYLKRPELTAEKFIPNPFSEQIGDRLYRTGDLVSYLTDGSLKFIGRVDNQVKIRGFRVELGEIEASLSQHPDVRETVVVKRGDLADSRQIVAYVVAQKEQTLTTEGGQRLTVTKLREFLSSKLPNYMMPAAFVILEAIPITPNGKVDYKALPEPETSRLELEETFIAPKTTVEKQLATIWAEVLGLEEIGINDNFFALGGDSILSLQVISKANQAGLQLTPKQLFQHQTIAKIADIAGTTQKIPAEQGILTGTLELSPIQHWFFEQKQPEPHHWNQAVLLESKQKIDPIDLEKIIESLEKHHDVLRLRFIREEFSTKALITSPNNEISVTYFDFSFLPEDRQVAAIEAAASKLQASLNLSQGPLFQVALFDLGDNQAQRLLWIIHHLAVDGVSWRVLIEDFQTAYQQINQGRQVQLPPKTTSFKQWSSYLQEYAQTSELLSERNFWLAIHNPSVSPIPRDFDDGNNLVENTSTVSVSLSVEETQSLLQQVPAAYRTQINDILLTALTLTFNQWTGKNSLLIDLEGHGREEIFEDVDLSRTVGWFTIIFPVYLHLEDTSDLGQAIKSIKEKLRKIPNRGIGYGLLRYLSQNKEIAEQFFSSQAEVIFNYLGQFDGSLSESSLFSLAEESSGSTDSLRNKRTHLLEINAGIYQRNLEISWLYSKNSHRQTTIEVLAQNFIETLRSLIEHCQSPDAGGFTPSDFADFQQSQWEQTDLDAITAAIGDI